MSDQETWDEEHVDGSKRARTQGEDPGAYIGHEPERATETIPGGVGRSDERVSAVDSQPGVDLGEDLPETATGWTPPPAGHREAERATDDRVREAGDRS